MIPTVCSSLSNLLSEKIQHYFFTQTVSESRYVIVQPDTKATNVAVKRRRLRPTEHEFHWLDRHGLNFLIREYEQMRQIFREARCIVLKPETRARINELLVPLLPALADNDDDRRKLEDDEQSHDLCALFNLFCMKIFAFLDTIYHIGNFIKVKNKFAQVPISYDHRLDSDARQTVMRIQNLFRAPDFLHILSDVLIAGGHDTKKQSMPTDMLGYVILDMSAMENNSILPSYIMRNHYHDKLLQELLSRPAERTVDQTPPGAYPEDSSEANISTGKPYEEQIESLPLNPHESNLKLSKTEQSRMRLLAGELENLDLAVVHETFHIHSDSHDAIKSTLGRDLEAKGPPRPEGGTLKSILKNRRTPKRLLMRLTPKNVHFSEDIITPQPRSHMGLDVPRLTPGNNQKACLAVGDVQRLQPGSHHGSDPSEIKSVDLKHKARGIQPSWNRSQHFQPMRRKEDSEDPSVAIDRILALPPIETLAISDDTQAGLNERKRKAARKAAEEAKQLAEEQERKQREKRLAKSGGLRPPAHPLIIPLSAEWHRRAHATLCAAATTTLATTAEGVDLKRHDFAKVVPPTEWLNDEIVNGSLNWLDQSINLSAGVKDCKKQTRKCLAFSSFFFKRLQEQGVSRTQRTLRRFGVEKRNILDVDTILFPICEQSHWTLLVVRPSKRTIAHMDSLNPRGSQRYINIGMAWLKEMLEEQYQEAEWHIVQHDAPLQTNGYDCGVHTITNGMCIALGLNPVDCYSSDDMPHQRLRLACMLLNGGFKGEFDLHVY
ncbi:sentrin/SUMO-specific protease [Moelleriella libera RCEF 2490]|uniref:Sentrin/SUMO-specific protease n=1 Tax=Moelleriella libera RCEF 2490 TaxID=1081109 RepID=A0A166P7P6_9HYPO|nr:sentrin/SUMO-specific protease [Moelleriella libera RCEF 2490]